MALRGDGRSSTSSSDAASRLPRWGAYGVSKAALDHLARSWAAELTATGVRFLAVDPARWTRACTPTRSPTRIRATLQDPADVARRFAWLLDRAPRRSPSGARVAAGGSARRRVSVIARRNAARRRARRARLLGVDPRARAGARRWQSARWPALLRAGRSAGRQRRRDAARRRLRARLRAARTRSRCASPGRRVSASGPRCCSAPATGATAPRTARRRRALAAGARLRIGAGGLTATSCARSSGRLAAPRRRSLRPRRRRAVGRALPRGPAGPVRLPRAPARALGRADAVRRRGPGRVEMPSAGRPLAWRAARRAARRGVARRAPDPRGRALVDRRSGARRACCRCPSATRSRRDRRRRGARRARGAAGHRDRHPTARALEGNAQRARRRARRRVRRDDAPSAPASEPRIVDAILTGMHEAGTSHFELLRRVRAAHASVACLVARRECGVRGRGVRGCDADLELLRPTSRWVRCCDLPTSQDPALRP